MNLKILSGDGIQWIYLNHPPVNSLRRDMLEGLLAELQRCKSDPAAKVVVIAGEGQHFCAGVDIKEQHLAWQEGGEASADLGTALYEGLLEFPKPLIAMVQGAVAGAGLSIIACCDLAIAAKGTRISLPEINIGVLGGVSHAKRVLGKSVVNYLALTGQPIEVDKQRHASLFLDVVELANLQSTTRAIAQIIASKHPDAIKYTKKCMRVVEGIDQLEGYVLESRLSKELRSTGVTDILVQSFLHRRRAE